MAISLKDQVAVVTGAGRGIGRAIALDMAQAGAAVVVNDVSQDVAGAVVAEIRANGGKAAAAVAEIGDEASAQLCVDTATREFGRMDVFVANAGVLRDAILWKVEDGDFDLVIRTHLRGAMTCGRAAARYFRQEGHGGAIVLVSSVAGQRGNVGQTAYAAAKAGVAALARTWSMELSRAGVSVNAIVPTALTRMVATIPGLGDAARAAEQGEPIPHRLRHELGLGTPGDVAPLVVFLASDQGRRVTGQCIGIGGDRLSIWSHPQEIDIRHCDGGWSAEGIARTWTESFEPLRQSVGIDLKT